MCIVIKHLHIININQKLVHIKIFGVTGFVMGSTNFIFLKIFPNMVVDVLYQARSNENKYHAV